MSDTNGQLINGRYILQQKLGEGGMGIVHRATDRLTGDIIALKQVQVPTKVLESISIPSETIRQNMQLALAREFQTLATLRHPHIISVLDYGFVQTEAEPQPFYTMTYLPEAETLLEAGAQLPVAAKLDLIQQTLQGLAYLHHRGILHRDLKPENVLVTGEQVRILDFGLARHQEEAQLEKSSAGSIAYFAPELWDKQPASPASDLFALGVLGFELLAGRHPFAPIDHAFTDRVLDEEPDWYLLEVDDALMAVIAKLLAKIPEARYQRAQTVLAALAGARGVPAAAETEGIRESFLQAARFVGRKAELAQFNEALAQTQAGRSPIWLLGGESGVGKTRLSDEVCIQAMLQGFTVMRGQGVEGGGLPFQLWRKPVRHLLLRQVVTNLQAGILLDIVPDIDSLLGRDIPPAPQLDGRAYQQRLIQAIVDLFRDLPEPVLLLLEDLQWMSESLVVLQQMDKVIKQLPGVMVLGTYRHDENPDLPEELPGAKVLSLPRLDRRAIVGLTLSMLGTDVVRYTNIVEMLFKETEGNAYFLVEVMRALAEEAGQLAEIGRMTLPVGIFTGGMARLLQRRIQKVSVADQPLLQLAAIAGRQLDLAVLGVLAGDMDIVAWQHRVADAAVLTVRDNQWWFTHDKLRAAALIDLSDETRRALHRQIALALEQIYPDDENQYKTLLDHWHQAGDLDREMYYLVLVVKELIEVVADYDQAHILLERSLHTLPEGNIHRISLWNWQAESYIRQGSYAQAQELARQAQELAQRVADNSGVATSFNCLGLVAFFQGDYLLAHDYIQKSLAIRQAIGNQQDIATSLHSLGLVAFYQDDYKQAYDYYQQSLAIRQTLGDQVAIASSFSNLGNVVDSQGDHEQAQDYYRQSLAIRQAVGTQQNQTITLPNLGLVHLDLSRDHAYVSLRDALSLAQSIRAYSVMLEAVVGFAWLYLYGGHLVRAGELSGLAQHHPAHDSDVQIALDELWPQLEANLTLADLQATLARGKNLDLDLVVSELLNNFQFI
ncbi:MAG: tetratricopeptide repeat protein [Chloroflexi bacterium]|nr:tetratricopeptide repeat protein [Chloroflexota bacterium]